MCPRGQDRVVGSPLYGRQGIEALEAAVRVRNRDVGHRCMLWPASRAFYHGVDCLGRAGEHRFDAAAVAIAHPAGDMQVVRSAAHEVPVAHALHAASDDEVFDDSRGWRHGCR